MCDVNIDVGNDVKSVSKSVPTRLFLKTVFHTAACVLCCVIAVRACIMWFTLTDEQRAEPALDNIKKFVFCFFTNWNYMFQTLFLCLALTHDVLEWLDKNESNFGTKICFTRDLVFSAFVFPSTLFVSGMFWAVYWVDRELVFPKVYDAVVPWWFNHCVHTNIFVVIVIETLLQARRYPINRKLELGLNTFVSVLYAVVYYSIYFFAHRWLYGVFGVMTWWQVCLFQLLIWTSVVLFYMIQYPINRLIHGSEEEKHIELETKKNGIETQKTEIPKTINPDLSTPPFSTKSWSLKYKSIREQFENSRL